MELKVTRYDIRDDGVATVWFDRPGRGNSWTNRMNTEYRYLMAKLDADPDVRVVVVTGAGRQFCVGADTKALGYYTETDEEYASTVNLADNFAALAVVKSSLAEIKEGTFIGTATVTQDRKSVV